VPKIYTLDDGLFQPRSVEDHRLFSGLQQVVLASDYHALADETTAYVDKLVADRRRLEEALELIATEIICPELFPNEKNEDALAAKTALTIALAALEVSASQANPEAKSGG
jgi:hypothetical protein